MFWNRRKIVNLGTSDEEIMGWCQEKGLIPTGDKAKYCYGKRPNQHPKTQMNFLQNEDKWGTYPGGRQKIGSVVATFRVLYLLMLW
jgi:hypothetical protein